MVTAGECAVDDAEANRLIETGAARPFDSLNAARSGGCDYVLLRSRNGLELCGPDDKPGAGVRASFESVDPRDCSRRQPLGRAVGRSSRQVIDATAGLGNDSVRLACMGLNVTAIERSPIVAALFDDGLRAARGRPGWADIVDRITLRLGDATALLCKLSMQPDAVYIDPMYPPKRKRSALPPKRVQVLRAVIGDDSDARALLEIARSVARRVVVKRPPYAAPLADDRSHRIETKLVRYDVYIAATQPDRNELA